MPESDLLKFGEELESLLPAVMRQLFHSQEDEPLTDLPVMQLRVMRGLFPGRKPLANLAKDLRMSPSRLAHLLARLEDAGLVIRVEDENDRRVRYAELTPRAVELMTKRRSIRLKRTVQALEQLSPEEIEHILQALRLLLERTASQDPPSPLEPDLEKTL